MNRKYNLSCIYICKNDRDFTRYLGSQPGFLHSVLNDFFGTRGCHSLNITQDTIQAMAAKRAASVFNHQNYGDLLQRRNLRKLTFFGQAEYDVQSNSSCTLARTWWWVKHVPVISPDVQIFRAEVRFKQSLFLPCVWIVSAADCRSWYFCLSWEAFFTE